LVQHVVKATPLLMICIKSVACGGRHIGLFHPH
jgi:hypothetical protein